METKVKKREWVKNAAIILLAGLLVLTFFSNTIMNRNLPEVATVNVSSGKIDAKVRCSGTVTANGNFMVKAEKTQDIRAVMVKSGQTVEIGDVLFVLGSGESSDLEAAQEQLYQLQLSYRRTALGGSYNDYSADEMRLAAAWETYLQAENDLETMDPMGNTDSDGYRYLQRELDKATAERDAAKEAYDAMRAEAQTNLSAAESERLNAEQAVLLVEGWNANEPDPVKLAQQQRYLNDPQLRIDELKAVAASQPSYDPPASDADPSAGLDEETGGETGDAPDPTPEPSPDPTPGPTPDDTALKLEKWEDLLEKKQAVDAAQAALNAVSTDSMDAAQRTVDEIQEEMSLYNTSPEYQAAVEAKNTAYLNYLDLKTSLDARRNADARSNASLGLELDELDRQIEAQKAKIEELSGGEENQVNAKVSGTVQSVEVMAGDTVTKDSVLCVIEVPDMGYSLTASVSNDQAARLRVGDTAEVSNIYWGKTINVSLAAIKVDPKNPQTSKQLSFDVSGDVSAGSELSFSIGERSANYDWVVPKSAVHNDANGYFIYKVESRNSPLGNRYAARRVSVEILAQDDSSMAVSGELNWGDYVITTSSAPLKNGELVRLSDSAS